jgi:prophage regulatory protein
VKLIRLPKLIDIVGLKRPTIYKAMKAGTFPKPVNIGPRAVAWRSDEIEAWVEALPRSTGGALPPLQQKMDAAGSAK